MEQFFTPTRTRRFEESTDRGDPFEYTEVKLAVPVEDFLVYRWDWKDLWDFLKCDDHSFLLSKTTSIF
jgi:hypothetical protein